MRDSITKTVHKTMLEQQQNDDETKPKTKISKEMEKRLERINKRSNGEYIPELYLKPMEFRVLYALNGTEKTIREIVRNSTTPISYSDVHRTVYLLIEKGYIHLLGRKRHKLGIFVKATQEGIDILVKWQEKHKNLV